MARILAIKDQAVTRGVLDKDVTHEAELIEITFLEGGTTPHTIFVHRDGPFTDPQRAVQAWQDGELHQEPNELEPRVAPLPPQGEVTGGNFPQA